MNAGLLAIIAAVVMAIHVSGHAGILCEQFGHRGGVPQVVNVGRMHGEMAKENHAFLGLGGGFQFRFHPF